MEMKMEMKFQIPFGFCSIFIRSLDCLTSGIMLHFLFSWFAVIAGYMKQGFFGGCCRLCGGLSMRGGADLMRLSCDCWYLDTVCRVDSNAYPLSVG
ncbi:uncharacterized protein BO88DRAFT_154080 [Aspergillus vadensis CBS 113365]|uniref:Uncharacterized protein n=1 Tax=Aspergillus vadensis (strain CBS 113365 / IMI 142717 / IBT 24658) TaxID=1448311 RepID=A0A319AX59_ASPVC|nr:hypothetical protein BO88DRAFT_154080 [Aspergillus vadensis CBS 113365]PYH64829.1 hypothetical protein BO88DRAFT_154080 [Aspergillus vadensis CBS 113365]